MGADVLLNGDDLTLVGMQITAEADATRLWHYEDGSLVCGVIAANGIASLEAGGSHVRVQKELIDGGAQTVALAAQEAVVLLRTE